MPDTHEVDLREGVRYVVEVEGEIREAFEAPRDVAVGVSPNGDGSVFILPDESTRPVRPEQVHVRGRGGTTVAVGWAKAAALENGRYYFSYSDVRGSLWIGTP